MVIGTPLFIYCADVGSALHGNFGWARLSPLGELTTGSEMQALAQKLGQDLPRGRVALGVECPLFVPLRAEPLDLLRCRPGEGARSWSASAGITTLGTGIVQVAWLLRELRMLCTDDIPVFLTPMNFRDAPRGLLLWEAFVSGKRTTTHEEDASVAALEFKQKWPQIDNADSLPCVGTEVISLAGLALLRTGWSKDLRLLREKPIVIRLQR